jgi:hypothetical protein
MYNNKDLKQLWMFTQCVLENWLLCRNGSRALIIVFYNI